MMMKFRCWTKVKNYLIFLLVSELIIFVEKRQELTLVSAFSSYLTRSKETKDPENPEDRRDTDAVEVTLVRY